MVSRRTGTFSMEVKKTVDKGVRLFGISLSDESCSLWTEWLNLTRTAVLFFQKRVLKMHNDYYYTDIKGTPFRCNWSSYTFLNSAPIVVTGPICSMPFSFQFVNLMVTEGDCFPPPCLFLQCWSGSFQRPWQVLLQRKRVSWSRCATATLSLTLLTELWRKHDAYLIVG